MVNDAREHRVYTRRLWSDDWTFVPNLFCDHCTFCCAPEMPEAMLYWNYGNLKAYDSATYAMRAKSDAIDYYVKIEIEQGDDVLEWYGIIKQETDIRRGAQQNGELSGQQFLKAYGMEWLLDQQQITSSWTLAFDLTDQKVNRCIGFNLGAGDERGGRLIGNMAPGGGALGSIFCDRPSNAQQWTAKAIVDYLLSYHAPLGVADIARIPFYLDGDYADALDSLDWWKVKFSYEGRTVKELLDMLMHRNRMMSYKVGVVENEVRIQPFTFTEADILLPSGGGNRIRANALQTTLNYDNEARVKQFVLTRDTQPTYDKVRCRGDRVGVVWTMQNPATLDKDWTSDLQDDYNAGALSAAAASDYYVKSLLHENYRKTDKFSRVYCHYKIPAEWDGKSVTGEPVVIDPKTVSLTEQADPKTFWLPGLRIESHLPLRQDVDYETVTTIDNTDALTADNRPPEFLRPFGVHFKSVSQRAFLLHKPEAAQYYGEQPEQGQRQWACVVRPQEEACGVILDVNGAPQHVIAEDEFVAADTSDEASWQTELDWKDFYVTVYMLLDSFAEAVWPDNQLGGFDVVREKVIEVPGKRQIWIVPDTILDVKQDGTLKKSNGGWVENDGKELEDMARLTYDWYSRERRAIDLQVATLDTQVTVGSLITTIGVAGTLTTTNSVVTRLSFNFREQSHGIYTQYAELDLRGL